jgi:uncharacterized coiled-coil protein SlyX
VFYVLPEEPPAETEIRLELLEADGDLIRAFTRKKEKTGDGEGGGGDEDDEEDPGPAAVELAVLSADPGLNLLNWNLEYPGAEDFPGMILWNRNLDGPTAVPGEYRARLTVGEWSAEVPFEVVPDPRSSATPEDFRAQFDFVASVRDQLTETHQEIRRIREARSQLKTLTKRLEERSPPEGAPPVREAADALVEKLTAIEETLYQTKNQSPQDPLNFPIRLNDKLANLLGLSGIGDFRPTDPMIEVRDELVAAIDAELAELRTLWEGDLAEVNRLAAEAGVAAIMLPPEDEASEKEE